MNTRLIILLYDINLPREKISQRTIPNDQTSDSVENILKKNKKKVKAKLSYSWSMYVCLSICNNYSLSFVVRILLSILNFG